MQPTSAGTVCWVHAGRLVHAHVYHDGEIANRRAVACSNGNNSQRYVWAAQALDCSRKVTRGRGAVQVNGCWCGPVLVPTGCNCMPHHVTPINKATILLTVSGYMCFNYPMLHKYCMWADESMLACLGFCHPLPSCGGVQMAVRVFTRPARTTRSAWSWLSIHPGQKAWQQAGWEPRQG